LEFGKRIKRADPFHCAAQPHVKLAHGRLAQGPLGKIPNARLAAFDGTSAPTGPLLPSVLTTPQCSCRLTCAASCHPYPLSAEYKATLAFLLLVRFSATPLHFPSSPSCPTPINPHVVAAALLHCAPAADEPPQAPPSHHHSVPRVIVDRSFTASQAIPARSRHSRADTVCPGREGTAPSTPHLRPSPDPADRATSFASSTCCSSTTPAPTSAAPPAPHRRASFDRPPTAIEQPPR
jgi:hypothetical protein